MRHLDAEHHRGCSCRRGDDPAGARSRRFVARTWEWLEQDRSHDHGPVPPARRPGSTPRERFTMDDDYIEAVMTFFVRLWDRGLIYRANRIVNWCPYHRPRSPTWRSSTSRWTTRSRTSAIPSPTVTAATDHDRNRSARHDPGRRRRRRAPGRSPLPQRDRTRGGRAFRGAARARDPRRASRARVRHGRAEDHTRT